MSLHLSRGRRGANKRVPALQATVSIQLRLIALALEDGGVGEREAEAAILGLPDKVARTASAPFRSWILMLHFHKQWMPAIQRDYSRSLTLPLGGIAMYSI
jgi:hypothetical protein